MANDPSKESHQSTTSTATPSSSDRAQSGSLTRREPRGLSSSSPFSSVFQRWNDEMDRLFDDFGFGRNLFTGRQSVGAWAPQIEVLQRGNDLVVRADLPGLTKDDIQVDINDDVLTIQGERKQQHEEEREGWYRNERTYGSFYRAVPLPEGTIADSAKASFKDGVLEVVLQTPPREVSRGRRLEIKDS
jgi:HSP20 family protein